MITMHGVSKEKATRLNDDNLAIHLHVKKKIRDIICAWMLLWFNVTYTDACVYAHTYIMIVCIYNTNHACACARTDRQTDRQTDFPSVNKQNERVHEIAYACIHVCIICTYVYLYVHDTIYIHTQTYRIASLPWEHRNSARDNICKRSVEIQLLSNLVVPYTLVLCMHVCINTYICTDLHYVSIRIEISSNLKKACNQHMPHNCRKSHAYCNSVAPWKHTHTYTQIPQKKCSHSTYVIC
jgi:hypothetical protein